MPEDIVTLADIQEDEANANLGTERGAFALQESLVRYAPTRSIVVDRKGKLIAGEKTKRTAEKLGLPIEVVKTTGDKLVVVQREDLDEDVGLARALSIADNRVAELNLAWDAQEIAGQVEAGLDLLAFFYDRELEELARLAKLAQLGEDDEEEADDFDPVPEMDIQSFEHYDYVMFSSATPGIGHRCSTRRWWRSAPSPSRVARVSYAAKWECAASWMARARWSCSMRVVIPSRKRVQSCAHALRLFPGAKVCVDVAEEVDYAPICAAAGVELLLHPSSVAGIGTLRQWILDNVDDETVFMVDDDVSHLGVVAGRVTRSAAIRVKFRPIISQ